MAGRAAKRLNKELSMLNKEPLPFATVEIVGDNALEWVVTIAGPEGTPYHGGKFKVDCFSAPHPYYLYSALSPQSHV
jgi:ubiquitin-protein ligase